MKWLLMFCGMYLIGEGLISLFWKANDQWMGSKLARVSRIIIGVFILWVSYTME
jgi:hypothetical protein